MYKYIISDNVGRLYTNFESTKISQYRQLTLFINSSFKGPSKNFD